jgi:hypothetical protein
MAGDLLRSHTLLLSALAMAAAAVAILRSYDYIQTRRRKRSADLAVNTYAARHDR